MQALLFEPFLTRPHPLHTLADAVAAMYADMRTNPADFGTDQQLRNLHYLVRWGSDAVCDVLGKARTEIALEEILDLDEVLIRHALDEGADRKHASVYATGCRKIIEYARNRGWSCDAVVRMAAWEPVLQALTGTKDCAVQLVRFLIAARKTPGNTTEADLQSWHTHATKNGMFAATADRILIRFRGRMRLSQLTHLFPLLDLESKKRSSYRKQKGKTKLAIRAEITELVALRSSNHTPDRAACKALRPSSLDQMVDSIYQIYGCLEDELTRGPFENLAQVLTTTNLCNAIDWLVGTRGLLGKGIRRVLAPILALAKRFPDLNSGEVRKHIKRVFIEPNYLMWVRKQAAALLFEELKEIPGKIQMRIDAGGLTDVDAEWLLHDKAIVSVQLEFLFRQRNVRECKGLDTDGANLVWRKLNPKDMEDLIIPDCVRAAYQADRLHTREFLTFHFTEKETKGKREQTEVVSLDGTETLQNFLDVRTSILKHLDAKRIERGIKPEGDPGTLFFDRHGHALREHSLRNLVRRLTRNYAGKAVPPHLWRDIFMADFRILLAIGVESDSGKPSKRLWHVDQPTTDKYNHLHRALAGIAMLNQQHRASQQSLRKETSEQLVQLESQRERAA